jgi:hypothetical protein
MQKKRKKTAFVPRFVFASACAASVVPLCVASCGGAVESQEPDGAILGVGAAYGVADLGFDVAVPFDAPRGVADVSFDVAAPFDGPFGVADIGFDAADSGDAPKDAPKDGLAEG